MLGKRVNDAALYFTPALKAMSSGFLAQVEILRDEKRNKLLIGEFNRMEVQFFEQIKKINKASALCENLLKGKDFGREEQERILNLAERKKEFETAEVKSKAEVDEMPKKKVKTDSKKLSCELFRQGMAVSEIAATRNLAQSTVEGHLALGITKGYITLEELLTAEAIEEIQTVVRKLENPTSSLIREKVQEKYSYSEIRYVLNDNKRRLLTA